MNVEDTMAFILDSQSKAQERMDRADARMDRADARMDRADARMDRYDKQLAATKKLVDAGMKMITRFARDTRREIKELKDSQKATDQALRTLIRSLGKSTNGRG